MGELKFHFISTAVLIYNNIDVSQDVLNKWAKQLRKGEVITTHTDGGKSTEIVNLKHVTHITYKEE